MYVALCPSRRPTVGPSLTRIFPTQTEKRDALVAWEKEVQQKWENDAVFQPNAPTIDEIPLNSISSSELREKYPKFFGTIAYPYMFAAPHPPRLGIEQRKYGRLEQPGHNWFRTTQY